MRVLRLTSPPMSGDDVMVVQEVLNASTEVPAGVLTDGVYGPATGSAVKAWKYRAGAPREAVNSGLGLEAQRVLLRAKDAKLPPAWAARRIARLRIGFKPGWGIPKIVEGIGVRALGYGEQFVGLTESPPGSNKIPALVSEGRRLGVPSAGMGFPFCAYFFFLCSLAVGGKAARAGLVEERFNALFTPEIGAVANASQHHLMTIGASQVRPGDGALFNFDGGQIDHIGRVVRVAGGRVYLEGNTSFGPGGSQSNGGAIAMRTDRSLELIQQFFREVA